MLQAARQQNGTSNPSLLRGTHLQLLVEIQLSGVDAQDLMTGYEAGKWHLYDLPKPSRPDQCLDAVMRG